MNRLAGQAQIFRHEVGIVLTRGNMSTGRLAVLTNEFDALRPFVLWQFFQEDIVALQRGDNGNFQSLLEFWYQSGKQHIGH